MKLQTHVVTGCGVGWLLYRFWGDVKSIFFFIFFFLGSILIDSDHFIDLIWRSKFKIRNIKAMLEFIEVQLKVLPGRKDTLSFFIFHSVEFLLLVGLPGILIKSEFLSSALMGIFWGALFHIVLDMIYVRKLKIRYAWSLVWFLKKRNLMRKKGIDPDKVYREILDKINATPTK